MKLLMVSGDSSLASGKKGAFYNTLELFHQYWDRIDIICPKPAYRLQPTVSSLFGNVFIHPSPWTISRQPWWIIKQGRKLYSQSRHNLATVHEYPPFYNGLGALWLWEKIHLPYLLEIHHIPGYPIASNTKERLYCSLARRFLETDIRRAVAVRVVNQHEVPEFLIRCGIPREKIIYIPSMYIDLNVFKPANVDKKYDLVCASRFSVNKGIIELIKAIAIVKKFIPDVSLLLIGDGGLRPHAEKVANEIGLANNVAFSGWLNSSLDVASAFSKCRVYVNNSRNEGGPRVAVEAMACGLPVVTTRVGLMNDIINEGENGFFSGWQINDLAETLIKVLRIGSYDRYRQTAHETAQQFERSAMIKNYAETLKKLI